jgi:curved DNA-binding protein CbpA
MADRLSYYDILGVLPGASADEIQQSYTARISVLAPAMIAGAPSKAVAIVDRARAALDEARRTLLDTAARRRYDTEIGVLRPGTGLAAPVSVPSEGNWTWLPGSRGGGPDEPMVEALGAIADWLAPRPAPTRRVAVPDVRGMFIGAARSFLTMTGLRAEVVRLTSDPLPVEGLVVDQSPRADTRVRRMATVTVQVWHPARRA